MTFIYYIGFKFYLSLFWSSLYINFKKSNINLTQEKHFKKLKNNYVQFIFQNVLMLLIPL